MRRIRNRMAWGSGPKPWCRALGAVGLALVGAGTAWLLNMGARADSDSPTSSGLANLLNEVERAVTNELQLFDADNDVEHLKRAFAIAQSLRQTADQKTYSPEAALAKIRLMLVVADKCFKARDKSYDVRKMPDCVVRVFPPPSAGPNAYPGMLPEEIKDPEARKQYEAAIAENERKRAKHKRELELQRMIDRAVRFTQLFLEGRPPERRDALLGVLANAVQEVEIRRLILSDSESTSAPKRPESKSGPN